MGRFAVHVVVIGFVCDWFGFWSWLGTTQVSQKEYIEDLLEPMKKVPELKWYLMPLWLIPVIGQVVVITHLITTSRKAVKFVEKLFNDFNEKYEKSRGVHLKYAQTFQETPKGRRQVDTIVITVKQPGVPIPGVPLFTLSKEGLIAVQAYQQGVQTGAPVAPPPLYGAAPMAPVAPPPPYGAAPMAPVDPVYVTPTGYPPAAAPAAAAGLPPGYEVDPYMPYPV